MALRRVFVDSVIDGRAIATGARAHHLARVVRMKAGETVEVSDGVEAWTAVAESIDPRQVVFTTIDVLAPPPAAAGLELHLALIKLPRFEWALEKATELGVAAIVPVAAERSDGGLIKAAPKRVERWARIAEEAAQQSRRLAAPSVETPLTLAEALQRPAAVRYFIDFSGQDPTAGRLKGLSSSATVAIFVGPEGGWSDEELALAHNQGSDVISLGPQVLRSETAALAAVSILGHVLRTIE
ncbi:MAG: RsmE family RNA methyltransferase [Acidobacteria bacterium]|nr:RsmE family RNA methyltransferase [Acidobacteriota bacterium]